MKKVLAGGCFNSVHPGHIYFLKKAKELGDFLIVVLANDKNNRKPYAVPAVERKKALEMLGIADKVIIGHEKDFLTVIMMEKPDIIALGYDQQIENSLKPIIKKMGIQIVRIEKFGDYSTGKEVKQPNSCSHGQ